MNVKKKKSKTVSFRFTPDTYQQLSELSEMYGLSRNQVIEHLINCLYFLEKKFKKSIDK